MMITRIMRAIQGRQMLFVMWFAVTFCSGVMVQLALSRSAAPVAAATILAQPTFEPGGPTVVYSPALVRTVEGREVHYDYFWSDSDRGEWRRVTEVMPAQQGLDTVIRVTSDSADPADPRPIGSLALVGWLLSSTLVALLGVGIAGRSR
jgi:hypothetical protein